MSTNDDESDQHYAESVAKVGGADDGGATRTSTMDDYEIGKAPGYTVYNSGGGDSDFLAEKLAIAARSDAVRERRALRKEKDSTPATGADVLGEKEALATSRRPGGETASAASALTNPVTVDCDDGALSEGRGPLAAPTVRPRPPPRTPSQRLVAKLTGHNYNQAEPTSGPLGKSRTPRTPSQRLVAKLERDNQAELNQAAEETAVFASAEAPDHTSSGVDGKKQAVVASRTMGPKTAAAEAAFRARRKGFIQRIIKPEVSSVSGGGRIHHQKRGWRSPRRARAKDRPDVDDAGPSTSSNVPPGAVAVAGPGAADYGTALLSRYVDDQRRHEEATISSTNAVRGGSHSQDLLNDAPLVGRENGDEDGISVATSFVVVCGMKLTRRTCLIIASLLLVLVAAIVGAVVGSGAFSSGLDETKDGAKWLPPESTVSPLPDPTTSPTVYIPPECMQSKLPRRYEGTADHYGQSVAIDDETAVVGAPGPRDIDDGDPGSAYVYVRNGTSWTEQAQLHSFNSLQGKNLGQSLSIQGDTAVLGALCKSNIKVGFDVGHVGCAFVFERIGMEWVLQAKLLPEDIKYGDTSFGGAIALDGDTIIIGSEYSEHIPNYSGSAYVFARSEDDTWEQKEKIVPDDGLSNDRFGHSIALHGKTAVIGAVKADDKGKDSGAAYIYALSGEKWTQEAKLLDEDGVAGDALGRSVAVSKDTIVVGANLDDGDNYNTGSAFVFVRNGTAWSQQAKLLASRSQAGESFGYSVAVDGDTTVVGSSSGAAYVFKRSGTAWTQHAKLLPASHDVDASSVGEDGYGKSVDLSGDTVIVGAHDADNFGSNSGAYVTKLC